MKTIKLLCCCLLLSVIVYGHILHVPATYPTIQLAINAAKPGDTVLVAEGVYYEQISFLGKKPLLVTSEFLWNDDTLHISRTIIDGSKLQNNDHASVVYFTSGEDSTSILCGFTIRHGRGSYANDNMNDLHGGGIWIADAGAKIIHNKITHNTLTDSCSVYTSGTSGAGIGTKWNKGTYWLVIENNTIDSNLCISKYSFAFGAGIATSYNTRISYNNICHNTCSGILNGTAHGGGIGCGIDPSWKNDVTILIDHNTIEYNLAQSQLNLANSAAVYASDVPVVFSNNVVAYNRVLTAIKSGGVSGLYLFQPVQGSVVVNNIFRGNTSNRWGGSLGMQNDKPLDNEVLVENNYFYENDAQFGAALVSFNVHVKLQNNVFSGNHAEKGGAAFFHKNENQPGVHLAKLINNSFCGNTAEFMGGAVYAINALPLIINSVFCNDNAVEGPEIYSDTVEIAYTILDPALIFGKLIDGGGNIPECVQFSDPVFLTLSPSPDCDNFGALTYTDQSGETYYCPDHDITGALRPQGSIVDNGAYEYENKCLPPEEFEFDIQYMPNPFTTSLTIKYTLEESSHVKILVYNNIGQIIHELTNSFQLYGIQTLEWNTSSLPAGIYLCQLLTSKKIVTNKIIKIQ